MENFFQIEIRKVPTQDEPLVSDLLFQIGALGVEEDLKFSQLGSHYEVREIPTEYRKLRAYFEKKPSLELLKQEYPSLEFRLSEQENQDWMAEWKKSFKAFELCDGIWVVPSWLEAPSEAKAYFQIDPGMAFGTGTHETTRLMAKMMRDFARGESLLDVGTGTGLLALLGHHYGFTNLIATEIDEDARRTARENVELNHVKVHIPEEQVEHLSGEFDVVLANIIDGVLVDIQSALKARVRKSGRLVLSGILDERESEFLNEFDFSGFKKLHRQQEGEWVGFVWEKL